MKYPRNESIFRSGSPKTDGLGFIGTTLGKRASEEAVKAQALLRSMSGDMSLNEASKWLAEEYPAPSFLSVRPQNAIYIRNPNKKFPNSEKDVIVG